MEKPEMLAFQGFFMHIFVHRNARMTEMEQSGIEVVLAFADNVRNFTRDDLENPEDFRGYLLSAQ